ncbi:hypothetical protein MMC17_005386 [Xylographa soralifera]|nr:hypothetical protein [Xylographa soralifera]
MRSFGDLVPGDYLSLTYSQLDGISCPWEGRRESTEVAYSLLATCFAAFGAYGHLEHSLLGNRNGVNIAGKLFLFFFCPALPLVDLVFLRALPALATWLGLLKSERIEYYTDEVGRYVTTTSRSIRFILAQVIGMHVSYGEDAPESVPLANSIHRHFYVKQREDSRSVRTGQAIILAFSTVQCLGAAIKGIRRLVRGSDSLVLADAETLWFAISGLLILLCSWVSFIQN